MFSTDTASLLELGALGTLPGGVRVCCVGLVSVLGLWAFRCDPTWSSGLTDRGGVDCVDFGAATRWALVLAFGTAFACGLTERSAEGPLAFASAFA